MEEGVGRERGVRDAFLGRFVLVSFRLVFGDEVGWIPSSIFRYKRFTVKLASGRGSVG